MTRGQVSDRAIRWGQVCVSAIWLVHGLYNKLLGGSPRHLAIVQGCPDSRDPSVSVR